MGRKSYRNPSAVYVFVNSKHLRDNETSFLLTLPDVSLYALELETIGERHTLEDEIKEGVSAQFKLPIEHIHIQWFDSTYPLLTLQIYPTFACPNSCKFCYLGNKKHSTETLTDEIPLIDFLTREIQELPVPFVEILGGEPLLPVVWRSLKNFIVGAVASDKLVHLSTAYGVNEENSEHFYKFVNELKSLLENDRKSYIPPEISVSIHGNVATERLLGIFTPIEWRETLIFYLGKKPNNKLVKLGISTVLTPLLEKHIEEYILLIKPLLEHIDYLNLMYPMGEVPLSNRVYLSLEEAWKIARLVSSKVRKINDRIKVNFNMPFQYAFKYKAGMLKNKIETIKNNSYVTSVFTGCSGAKTKIEILPNGDVIPCGLFIGNRQFYYPLNLLEERSVFTVWKSGQQIRNMLYNLSVSHHQNASCLRCSLINVCEICPYIIMKREKLSKMVECPIRRELI